jgi:signal peptidase II
VRFNPGVAFSTFADNPIAPYISGGLNILVALTLILIAAVHYTKMRMLLKLGVLCVSSGALSNALDRIIQFISTGHPYVTDFIEYPGLFTGNLADIYVVVGAIWLGFGIIRQYLR